MDVTDSHLFLGYKPVIIGIVVKRHDPRYKFLIDSSEIKLTFHDESLRGDSQLAILTVRLIEEYSLEDGQVVFLYEGVKGTHRFLNFYYQHVNRLKDRFRIKPAGNVSLPGNLVDQVRIAYSVPRLISIITVSDGKRINMFPTDLHGPVGERYYAGSLRDGGLANEQVTELKKLVVADVGPEWFESAYALGKNHMQPLRGEGMFNVHAERSKEFNFPLPAGVIRYREMKEIGFSGKGIHKIHFYDVLSSEILDDTKAGLAHIHQYYLQWRLDNKIPTPWLRR